MSLRSRRTLPAALAVAALGLSAAVPGAAVARHGADDAAGHQRHSGERHHAKHHARHTGRHHARHGADDGPNHR